MFTFIQRHTLWLFVILAGLAGLAVANLCTTYLGTAHVPLPVATSAGHTVLKPQPRAPLSNYNAITRNNIFNMAARNKSVVVDGEPVVQTTTQSSWTLIGTISGGRSPLATLQSKAEVVTLGIGDELPDGGTLTLIERNRVEITYRSGQRVVLVPQEEEREQAAKKNKESRSQSGSATAPEVVSLGDNRWVIPAMVAEQTREKVGDILKQARAVPVLENGQTTGFKLLMVKPRSIIDQLGLKRGDVLKQVNGLALDSPEKALQIFAQLRQAKQVQIDLERKGKPMTFAYEIR